MGAWSHEVMCNDTVLDAMNAFKNFEKVENKEKMVKNIVSKSMFSDYIDEQLLGIALVDISMNGINEDLLGNPCGYEYVFSEVEKMDLSSFKDSAVELLDFIIGNDYVWFGDSVEKRKKMLKTLKQRLGGKK